MGSGFVRFNRVIEGFSEVTKSQGGGKLCVFGVFEVMGLARDEEGGCFLCLVYSVFG